MKLSKEALRQMIVDVIDSRLDSKDGFEEEKKPKFVQIKSRKDKRSDRERRDDTFPGHSELTQLSHGIVEQNPNHDSDGKFSDEELAACVSTYFAGPKKRKSTKGKKLKDEDEAGRGPNKHKGKGKLKCKDSTPSWMPENKDAKVGTIINEGKMESFTIGDLFLMIDEVHSDTVG